ncbi:uncharacterized protein LOC135817924 [Sycon ciliatum]|uniref:uncharacterized protein LOC135817924 n=1 Tax=Sycon ciliatum TaxID=27933 RepID=UPI0031F70101
MSLPTAVRVGVQFSFCALVISTISVSGSGAEAIPKHDTSEWIGASYTPSSASNSLWWWNYSHHEDEVKRELSWARQQFGFTALRMFLHSMVYEGDNGTTLIEAISRFLLVADSNNIGVGFVFFDDCWSTSGANLSSPCQPVKGRHNGCWKTSPQAKDRTTVDRYQPYVSNVASKFKDDKRVLWWEIYNEPHTTLAPKGYSIALRQAAYTWLKKSNVSQPVLSCWDDNNDTDIVDTHHYSSDFTGWTSAVYSNPDKGAVVTEAGSRWYQGYPSDSGSTLMVVTWLQALRQLHANWLAGKEPCSVAGHNVTFVPGAMISWELMVGNSNTRWHWNTKDGSPEPAIPWDAHLFPDGTPVSLTEAAALRNLTTEQDEFLYYNTSLPVSAMLTQDSYLNMTVKYEYIPWIAGLKAPMTDAVAEAAIWVGEKANTAGLIMRQRWTVKSTQAGYYVGVNVGSKTLSVARWTPNHSPLLGTYDLSKRENGLILNGWNLLRVAIVGNITSVWFNPAHSDAVSEDGSPQPIKPLIVAGDVPDDPEYIPSGDLGLITLDENMKVDYVSVLPISALPPSVLARTNS